MTAPNETTLTDRIRHAVETAGYVLDPEQLHIGGERALMSAHKLVLTGTTPPGSERVVIKASLDDMGTKDIAAEHAIRELLRSVRFASKDLSFPAELFYGVVNGVMISVTEFIEQERVFVEYPLREQFFMILKLFESQEEFHATTYEHTKSLMGVLPVWNSSEYMNDVRAIKSIVGTDAHSADLMQRLVAQMESVRDAIDRYSGFLDHTDLVPHNFRIKNGSLYALDQVAIRFGNKYEMWARFINYMVIHNPDLADLLVRYVEEKRGGEDALMLRIMRCYKVGVLLRYYADSMKNATDSVLELTRARFAFWSEILGHLLENTPIPRTLVTEYTRVRDTLRTDEEKKRQREFAKA
jgi:hypothetical protein